MTAPYRRRREPTPVTQGWEIAVAGTGLALIVLVLTALAGIGVAAALFGSEWVWPHGPNQIAHTLGGLLTGHLGHGLPAAAAHRLAGPAATYACVAASEAALIAGGIAVGVAVVRRLRSDGMATRHDAHLVLGIGQLRAARLIIRPDLYGPNADDPARRRTGRAGRRVTT